MKIGNVVEYTETVAKEDLASYMGSGDQDVLATPKLICWMERASVMCLALEDKELCSLGVFVSIEHIAATPLGVEVTIKSKLVSVEGKKYVFEVEAFDKYEKIGFGKHERVVTNVAKFMERTNAKGNRIG